MIVSFIDSFKHCAKFDLTTSVMLRNPKHYEAAYNFDIKNTITYVNLRTLYNHRFSDSKPSYSISRTFYKKYSLPSCYLNLRHCISSINVWDLQYIGQ